MGDQGIRALVPRRADNGHRDELWRYCATWWANKVPEMRIVEGSSPDGPFNRAAAINDAAVGDWAVAVVLDADVVAEPEQVREAIQIATTTGRMTLAFERFQGLNAPMTKRILEGVPSNWNKGVRFRSDIHESSIVAVPRALWDVVGGFDERFRGWGQEDVAFAQACRVLGGELQRVPGLVWHLWHPRAPERRVVNDQYQANQALGVRYRFTREPEAMRALLEERWTDAQPSTRSTPTTPGTARTGFAQAPARAARRH